MSKIIFSYEWQHPLLAVFYEDGTAVVYNIDEEIFDRFNKSKRKESFVQQELSRYVFERNDENETYFIKLGVK